MPPLDKFFRTYQNILVSSALLVFCVIGMIFGVVPSALKIQELAAQVKDVSEQTSGLQKKLDTLINLDEDTLRRQLTDVLSAVPAERSFPTLFETVEGIAARTGTTVVQMHLSGGTTLATPSAAKVSASDKKLGTRTIPFSVTISGSLQAVQEFITLAPKVRRLLRIRTFSISFPRDVRPLSVAIEMDAFYEPLPTSLGTAKTLLPQLSAADEDIISKLGQLPLITQENGELPPPLIGRVKDDPFAP
jgi:hypothetical protein